MDEAARTYRELDQAIRSISQSADDLRVSMFKTAALAYVRHCGGDATAFSEMSELNEQAKFLAEKIKSNTARMLTQSGFPSGAYR